MLSVNSFVVKDENSKKGKLLIKQSEELFTQKALSHGAFQMDMEDHLDCGNFDNMAGYSLMLAWAVKAIE